MNKRFPKANASGVTPQRAEKERHSPSRGASNEGRERRGGRVGGGGRGVGGGASASAAAGGTRAGPPAYAFVGRVRNLGRGVWGFGSIVGWIPADVRPWNWARRMGWRQVFSRRTGPLVRTRPYVLGDDGRFHLAERWEVL